MTPFDASTVPSPALSASHRGAAAPIQPISRLMAEALAHPELISLAAGFVDSATLPTAAVAEAVARLMAEPAAARSALQYGENTGDATLRRLIAERYLGEAAAESSASMVLSAGSNQLLHLIAECLLDPGDIVLCAAPTYFVFLGAIRDIGARSYGIATDAEGICPDALEEALEQLAASGQLSRVKMLYLVPYFDNPAGTNMPAERRLAILEVLERWRPRVGMALLVDNAYRDLRFEGVADVPSLTALGAAPEWTIETGTFSKNFSPGLRVGWGVLPEPLYAAVCRRKAIIDFGSTHFSQCVIREVLADGALDAQLQTLRRVYGEKATAMVRACHRDFGPESGVRFESPGGGLYVWLRFPETIATGPDSALWQAAVRRGVLYVPGELCFADEGTAVQRHTLRLSFGVQTPEKIDEGVRLLAEAFADVQASAER